MSSNFFIFKNLNQVIVDGLLIISPVQRSQLLILNVEKLKAVVCVVIYNYFGKVRVQSEQ